MLAYANMQDEAALGIVGRQFGSLLSTSVGIVLRYDVKHRPNWAISEGGGEVLAQPYRSRRLPEQVCMFDSSTTAHYGILWANE